jgi:hypothetical protein
LEELLKLGTPLTDNTSVGKMRDSYALKLFSLSCCCQCADAEKLDDLMYLLPWTLQEEVIRSPTLSRGERLMKAIASFELLFHYYELSKRERARNVGPTHRKGVTCLTFAEDCCWARILNTALVLIQFVMIAEPTWSFSRLGTHCLENFFGMVRRCSHGDDRNVTARRVISRASLVTEIMQELGLEVQHRGRDNVGGVVISEGSCNLDAREGEAAEFTEMLIALCGLRPGLPRLDGEARADALEEVRSRLASWRLADAHHKGDPLPPAAPGSPANASIVARTIAASQKPGPGW